MQIAIMSAEAGSVYIYQCPAHITTGEGAEEWARETLSLSNHEDWIACDNIVLSDTRK